MTPEAYIMTMFLDTEVIKNPYDKDRKIMDKIHAFIFVYDSSNKKNFSLWCHLLKQLLSLRNQEKKD